jgi:citrate synthase
VAHGGHRRSEHGFSASAFTPMTVGSTDADIYSDHGGIGVLSGPLHSWTNRGVIETGPRTRRER